MSGSAAGAELLLLRYRWTGYTPVMEMSDPAGGEVTAVELRRGDRLDVRFSGTPVCVGVIEDGVHTPCPGSRRPMKRFAWCRECGSSVVADPACIFEPRCDGSDCPDEFCSRPHAIYLALFGTRGKVGMTSAMRLEERLVEQGADAYVMLAGAGNRKEARGLEKVLAKKLRLPQVMRGDAKLRMLSERPDRRGMAHRAEEVSRAALNVAGLRAGELTHLTGYPLEQPLTRRPNMVDAQGVHAGELVGMKGAFVLYRDDATGQLKALRPGRAVGLTVKMVVE